MDQKAYLTGIQQQVEENIFNYNTNFKIADFTKIYVNEFRFSDVKVMEVENDEDYVENLTKMYLKFDFEKSRRLSKAEERKYIKKYFLPPTSPFLLLRFSGYMKKMLILIILLEMLQSRYSPSRKKMQ